MMPASSILTPVISSDEPFLIELYAFTSAEEMALVPWNGELEQVLTLALSEYNFRFNKTRGLSGFSRVWRESGEVLFTFLFPFFSFDTSSLLDNSLR